VRRSGPLQNIVIPPCPELLARLRTAISSAEPDLNEVARIATSDVAMSATLLKSANSPLFASVQPVQTIGAAMDRLGLNETAAVMSRMLVARAIKVTSPQLQRFWERAAKRSVSMHFLATKLDSRVFVPADRHPDRGWRNRQTDQCEKGSISRSVGHEERHRQNRQHGK
jgi:HD-like signal output (HDOD) protein